MNELSGEVLVKRARFLSVLRKFFEKEIIWKWILPV